MSNIFMCSFAKVIPLLQELNFVHLWYSLSLPSKSKDIKWSFIIVSKVAYYDFEPYLHSKIKVFKNCSTKDFLWFQLSMIYDSESKTVLVIWKFYHKGLGESCYGFAMGFCVCFFFSHYVFFFSQKCFPPFRTPLLSLLWLHSFFHI